MQIDIAAERGTKQHGKTTVSAILLAAGSSSRMGENKMLMRFAAKHPSNFVLKLLRNCR